MNFDPYETWLGIPADRRPPTHYDLLGLAPDESDPAAIDQAALRRMSKVRQHQFGPQSDLSQEVLAELARARLILMDPDRRTDYDAKLQTRGETHPGPLVTPVNVRNGDAARHRPCRHEDAPHVLGSLALTERAGDGPSSLPCAPDEGRAWWKKAFVIGPFVACAVLIGVVLYSAFSPSSLKQRPRDLVRNDSDRLTPTQKPKPSLPPAPKPVVTPEPAPPPIVEPPRADAPGGGGEQETPADVNLGRDKDDDRPDGLGQASKKSDLAAEDSPEQRLKDLGLQLVGTRYVLQQESEVRQKLEQAQASFNQCLSYLSQKNEMEAKLATFKSLSDTIIALRHDIDSANLTLSAWPPRYSNVEKDDFRAATAVRDSLEGEHIEARAQLDGLRSQLPSPRAIQEIDAKIQSLRQECESTVGEVRELINSMNAKYAELAKNDDAKAALAEQERRKKVKLNIGPSPEYNEMRTKTNQLEKFLNPTATMTPPGKRDKAGKGDKSNYRRDRKKG